MAVPAGPTEVSYVGNGVTTVFAVPFLVIQATDLAVYMNGARLISGYTQSGVGNPTSTVTFSVAPPNLSTILLQLDVPFERLNDYQENGDFLANTVNRDFDRIWQALKQLLRYAGRALTLGQFDIDGQGWYRAKGNGIRDLNDPVQDQDAATKRSVERYVAEVIQTGQGPMNNAANVTYIDGDYTVLDVQRGVLAQYSSIAKLTFKAGLHDQAQALLRGYYADTPGHGGGEFYWDALSTETPNPGTIFAVSGVTTGRWKRKHSDVVDVADFGGRRDASMHVALQAAADWCRATGAKLVGNGPYQIGAFTVNLRKIRVDLSGAYIACADGATIILGNRSNTAEAPAQELGVVRVPTPGNAQVTSVPTVKVIGSKGQRITIASTNWLQVWASVSSVEDASSAYSTYNLGDIARIDLVADPAYPTGIQWINENTFNIKRIYNAFVIKSDFYSHNHNIINTGTFEEGAVISVERGDNNQFLCQRFEGSSPIVVNMGASTWDNVVEKTWHGNQQSAYDPVDRAVARFDNGEGNMILRNTDYKMKHSEVLTVNSRTCRSYSRANSNTTSLRGVYVSAHGLDNFEITQSFQVLGDTGKIPVRVNDGFQAILDGTKMRCRWMIYDVNGKEMTAVVDVNLARMDGGTAPAGGNVYTQGSGVPESFFIVRGATIGYVRCQVYGNGATGLGQLFKHFAVIAVTQHANADGPQRTNCMSHRKPAAAAKPTVGWAEPGDTVQSTSAAGTEWLCTFSLSTALATTMSAGSTSISTVSNTGTAVGDVVGIQQNTGSWHWTTLASLGVLSVAIPSAADAGNPVVYVRWV
ncbi:hypothetical protein [Pseudomonas soli]|uniref:Pectate lyase superfamily protein domain-containing protein n=1 Tax=Pseudomonas soli TaxID=1306993 RepID=A0AAJ5MJ26_9PSED|nr:hypothetical protein [Pseudomonas soli]UXZ44490.1 hypothetical protein K7K07_20815 [Pseudomonas soli]